MKVPFPTPSPDHQGLTLLDLSLSAEQVSESLANLLGGLDFTPMWSLSFPTNCRNRNVLACKPLRSFFLGAEKSL